MTETADLALERELELELAQALKLAARYRAALVRIEADHGPAGWHATRALGEPRRRHPQRLTIPSPL
jgi:hypothetical protein